MINYSKLWILLNSRGMKKTDLLQIISSPTLAKLGKNENVNTSVIEKICEFLQCQPGDIMENVTRDDIIKKGQEFNEKLGQVLALLQEHTDKTPAELFEEFMKEAPNFLEMLQNGTTDFIGVEEYIKRTENKE